MTAGTRSRHARRRPRQLRHLVGGATVLAAALVAEALGAGALTAHAAEHSVVLIDNSHADSWLEVDRAGNQQLGSGISGSDLDGAATDLTNTLLSPSRPGGKPHRALPEDGTSPDEDAAADGGGDGEADGEAPPSPAGPAAGKAVGETPPSASTSPSPDDGRGESHSPPA